MDKAIETRFYNLLSLQLSGDATPGDWRQLQGILEDFPEFRFLYDELMKPTEQWVTKNQTDQAFAGNYIKKIQIGDVSATGGKSKIIDIDKGFKKWKRLLVSAASLAGLVFLSVYFFNGFVKQKKFSAKNEMATPKGGRSKLTLPDGTIVVLNADSKLSFDESFKNGNREVRLDGEAYFDVTHDSDHPFIIHTQKADIKVLGTAFNVRSYPADSLFETTLIRGKVEITVNNGSHRKVILRPMEKVIIRPEHFSLVTQSAVIKDKELINMSPVIVKNNVIPEISWKENTLTFINEPLGDIAKELERQFNISVIFKTNRTKNFRYTGVFENPELGEVLQILRLSKKIDYKLTKTELIIE